MINHRGYKAQSCKDIKINPATQLTSYI